MVELYESFTLRYSIVDRHGIDVFHIREADELVDSGIVTDVASNPIEFEGLKFGLSFFFLAISVMQM